MKKVNNLSTQSLRAIAKQSQRERMRLLRCSLCSLLAMTVIFLLPTFSKGIPQVGSPAPNFLLRGEKDNFVYSKDYYGKKIIILCFWTTHCKYCKETFNILEKIDEKYKDNLQIFLVNFGEKPKKVKEFIKEKKIKLKVIFDIYGKTAQRFGVYGVPYLFIIDKNADISFILKGYRENLQEIIEEELKKL